MRLSIDLDPTRPAIPADPDRSRLLKVSIPSEITMHGRPSDDEALRLVLAFYCIVEPEKRLAVSALAEQLARDSLIIEGVTHFKLLDDTEQVGATSKVTN